MVEDAQYWVKWPFIKINQEFVCGHDEIVTFAKINQEFVCGHNEIVIFVKITKACCDSLQVLLIKIIYLSFS